MSKPLDLSLAGRIFSAPAIGLPAGGSASQPPLFGLIKGIDQAASGKTTVLDLIDAGGRSRPGFPFPGQGGPFAFAPGPQVGAVPPLGRAGSLLMAIDSNGQLWQVPIGEDKVRPVQRPDPSRGWLTTPPFAVIEQGRLAGVILASRSFEPYGQSRDAVHLVDAEGRTLPGWPVALPQHPAENPPVVESGRAYVVLENGAVVALDLPGGRSREVLPAAATDAAPGQPRMAWSAAWGGPVVSTGGKHLTRLKHGGGAELIDVPGARRLGALAGSRDYLFALDDDRGKLLRLDATGRVLDAIDLGGRTNGELSTIRAIKQGGVLLVVSVTEPIHDVGSRIDALFEEHADADTKRTVQQLAAETARRDFGTDLPGKMTPAQRRSHEYNISAMKHSWLQNNLGFDESEAGLETPAGTHINVASYRGGGMTTLLDDRVVGYTPDTGSSALTRLPPSVQPYAGGWLIAVALNKAGSDGGASGSGDSRLRVYFVKP